MQTFYQLNCNLILHTSQMHVTVKRQTVCGTWFPPSTLSPKDQIQVVRLGNECLYPLSILTKFQNFSSNQGQSCRVALNPTRASQVRQSTAVSFRGLWDVPCAVTRNFMHYFKHRVIWVTLLTFWSYNKWLPSEAKLHVKSRDRLQLLLYEKKQRERM